MKSKKHHLLFSVLLIAALLITGCVMPPLSAKPPSTSPTPASPPFPSPTLSADNPCGIENCHGLTIRCGPNVSEVCTMVYTIGDRCKRFASCKQLNGSCVFVNSPEFETCKRCVEKCLSSSTENSPALFECEGKC